MGGRAGNEIEVRVKLCPHIREEGLKTVCWIDIHYKNIVYTRNLHVLRATLNTFADLGFVVGEYWARFQPMKL